MSIKIYEYKGCGTCVKALKFLKANDINFETIAIREQAPTKDELTKMLEIYDGNSKKLFNTSGQDYRAQKLSGKLPNMTIDQQFDLLMTNGNLVKRPFVITEDSGIVGFKEDSWKKLFNL